MSITESDHRADKLSGLVQIFVTKICYIYYMLLVIFKQAGKTGQTDNLTAKVFRPDSFYPTFHPHAWSSVYAYNYSKVILKSPTMCDLSLCKSELFCFFDRSSDVSFLSLQKMIHRKINLCFSSVSLLLATNSSYVKNHFGVNLFIIGQTSWRRYSGHS